MPKTKRVRFEVTAHHNVEDFRPYKVSFDNRIRPRARGSAPENVKQALYLAIKREGERNGWFNDAEECGELGGKRTADIKNAISEAVNTAWLKGGTKEAVVFGYDFDEDETNPVDYVGLVVWAFFDRQPGGVDSNFGFGMARKDPMTDSARLSSHHTDKYSNKWVELVA